MIGITNAEQIRQQSRASFLLFFQFEGNDSRTRPEFSPFIHRWSSNVRGRQCIRYIGFVLCILEEMMAPLSAIGPQ